MSIIEIKDVTFRYKGSEEGLLKNISLSFEKGETVLLCGASGCGKTTIIRLINGLIPHYYKGDLEGDVTVAGKKIRETELYELAGTVGTVFQNPRSQFFSVDTDGEIVFGPENIGLPPQEIRKRAEEVIEQMDIRNLLGRSLFDLSGGQKQKIACASVSALLPEIVLLDEPSSNLDRKAMEDLREAIFKWKAQGKTIIISEHRLWYLRDLVDRVLYLEKGSVIHEWTGDGFRNLSEAEINELQLRPVTVEDDTSRRTEASVSIPDDEALILKDFFFAYDKKPRGILHKKYSSKDRLDLNIPELRLPRDKVIAVVGHNGTGKSTFLRCLCGLERSCTGRVIADGREFKRRDLLKLCYMVMQDVDHQLFTDSVMAEVMLSMDDPDEAKCREILEHLGILDFADKHPMALSGGQKQRVAIASALAAGSKLLLFDEPTSGLDYAHMEVVGGLLRDLAGSGSTVLVSTHDPELIERSCDFILEIVDGRVGSLTSNSSFTGRS